jgi:hypothetical protein
MGQVGETPIASGAARRGRIERRLAAILAADIRGYSILMASNEDETYRRVGAAMDRLVRQVKKSHGHVFSFAGDGVMAEFPSAVEALKCALRIQADAAKQNARLSKNDIIRLLGGLKDPGLRPNALPWVRHGHGTDARPAYWRQGFELAAFHSNVRHPDGPHAYLLYLDAGKAG